MLELTFDTTSNQIRRNNFMVSNVSATIKLVKMNCVLLEGL